MGAILVIGGGGREHAIGRQLQRAGETVLFAPGNPGTAACGENVDVAATDIEGLVALVQDRGVELAVVGPEQPLVMGIADRLRAVGCACVGPSAAAAQLEGSKRFTRELANRVGVPGPHFVVVRNAQELRSAIEAWRGVPVLKADGLASGKGVFLPGDKNEAVQIGCRLLAGSLGDAGHVLVLEDRLEGVEASLFFACHGTDIVALPHARDHKRLGDGDTGPNTGGMGAISPNPDIDAGLVAETQARFVEPVLHALADAGTPFTGFLFVGLMLTREGPKLLEYNVRLGDPEAQAILPRLSPGDFARLCRAMAAGKLRDLHLPHLSSASCAIVLASAGYPDEPRGGDRIETDPDLESDDRWLIHAGTAKQGDHLVTRGGRVATLVATAADLGTAVMRAYAGVRHVRFPGMQHRRDIGRRKEAS